MVALLVLVALLSEPKPFVLVNASGGTMTDIAIRVTQGGAAWRTIASGPLQSGGRSAMPSPGGQLCGFDVRASIGGRPVTWTDVNLCDVRIVTLNRRPDGTLWADYD